MQAHPKLTIAEQRELMRFLMLRRERKSTTHHHDPAFVHRFWRQVAT
jgi:hypothetical protein